MLGTYKGIAVEGRGFSIDNKHLFTVLETGQTIYLSKTQIESSDFVRSKY
jgi:hypothetical protein